MSEEEATELLHDALRVRLHALLFERTLPWDMQETIAQRACVVTDSPCSMLIRQGAQVCYYRDKQTTNKFQIAKVTAEGVSVSEPFALETQWGYQARPVACRLPVKLTGCCSQALLPAGICQPCGKCGGNLVTTELADITSEQLCAWSPADVKGMIVQRYQQLSFFTLYFCNVTQQ